MWKIFWRGSICVRSPKWAEPWQMTFHGEPSRRIGISWPEESRKFEKWRVSQCKPNTGWQWKRSLETVLNLFYLFIFVHYFFPTGRVCTCKELLKNEYLYVMWIIISNILSMCLDFLKCQVEVDSQLVVNGRVWLRCLSNTPCASLVSL